MFIKLTHNNEVFYFSHILSPKLHDEFLLNLVLEVYIRLLTTVSHLSKIIQLFYMKLKSKFMDF
jgi:hypothetical protein